MAATTPQFGPPALADPSFGDLCDTYHNKAGFHVAIHGGPNARKAVQGLHSTPQLTYLPGK
jgi:hypothetical protein